MKGHSKKKFNEWINLNSTKIIQIIIRCLVLLLVRIQFQSAQEFFIRVLQNENIYLFFTLCLLEILEFEKTKFEDNLYKNSFGSTPISKYSPKGYINQRQSKSIKPKYQIKKTAQSKKQSFKFQETFSISNPFGMRQKCKFGQSVVDETESYQLQLILDQREFKTSIRTNKLRRIITKILNTNKTVSFERAITSDTVRNSKKQILEQQFFQLKIQKQVYFYKLNCTLGFAFCWIYQVNKVRTNQSCQ
ncbi:unnamed protein product [Paramecium octaurelia]|uniref:Transmembrane protein n=1 Tax=Paramecium octaurelia TaxID=43137 RepID=A0A8S1WM41_PAROT|nr:unnamed protein product [Paramecium octaurelia]